MASQPQTPEQLLARQRREQMKEMYALRGVLTDEERDALMQLAWNPQANREFYRQEPALFAQDILKMEMTGYQQHALNCLRDHRRVSIRAPHGAGKTTLAAAAVLWFVTTHDNCKVPTTASAWRQLIEFLWPEIHRWALKADWDRIGVKVRPGKELMSQRLAVSSTSVAFAISSNDEAKVEGAHAPNILYVLDEAKAIVPPIWDAIEGALSTGNTYALCISTPGPSVGRFYDIQMRKPGYEDWHVLHIKLIEAIKAGRIDEGWARQRAKAWGEESIMYRRRVLGEFAEEQGETVIPLTWIEAAQDRWREKDFRCRTLIREGKTPEEAEQEVWGPRIAVGVDPARMGTDKTAYAIRHGDREHKNGQYTHGINIREVQLTVQQDLMATAGHTVKLSGSSMSDVYIDVIGLGAGVFDRLRELWQLKEYQPGRKHCPATSVNVSVGTKFTDKTGELYFSQLRDYLWWHLRELLENGEQNGIALPPDETLTADLVTPTWGTTSSGRIKIESKDDMRKRLGRSPDAADAVMLALYPDQVPYRPMIGFL